VAKSHRITTSPPIGGVASYPVLARPVPEERSITLTSLPMGYRARTAVARRTAREPFRLGFSRNRTLPRRIALAARWAEG
jgi:hypothetical protein